MTSGPVGVVVGVSLLFQQPSVLRGYLFGGGATFGVDRGECFGEDLLCGGVAESFGEGREEGGTDAGDEVLYRGVLEEVFGLGLAGSTQYAGEATVEFEGTADLAEHFGDGVPVAGWQDLRY